MKKKILITTGILLVLILNLLVASGIFTKDVIAVEGSLDGAAASTSVKAAEPGRIIEGPNPGGYGYYLCGDFEAFTTSGAPYYNPQNGSYQIYCTAEGTGAEAYYWDITKAEAESCYGLKFNAHGSHASGKYEGLASTTFYRTAGTSNLSPWEAYIVSDEPVWRLL